MSTYSGENEKELIVGFEKLFKKYHELENRFLDLAHFLVVDKSKEYLFHGVMRRLGILKKCTKNILEIFPVQRSEKFQSDELKNLNINMHAFVFNVFGLLDNLAWVFVYEKKLDGKIDKRNVGILKEETKKYFSSDFQKRLEEIKKWYFEYLVNFRDSLSHRIPLYVPPAYFTPADERRFNELDVELSKAIKRGDFVKAQCLSDEREGLGGLSPYFCHSFSEKMVPQSVHGHLLSDFHTIEAVVDKYFLMFRK